MYEMKARDLGYVALSVALITVSAWIAIPFGNAPVTMQTTAVCLVAALLGAKRATFAVLAYILLGAVGVPVFAGFTGGVARLVAPTGGYLFGLIPFAFFVGMGGDLKRKGLARRWIYFACLGLGLLSCYMLGTGWFVLVNSLNDGLIGIWTALTLCVFPYLPFDVLKMAVVAFLTKKLEKFVEMQ